MSVYSLSLAEVEEGVEVGALVLSRRVFWIGRPRLPLCESSCTAW